MLEPLLSKVVLVGFGGCEQGWGSSRERQAAWVGLYQALVWNTPDRVPVGTLISLSGAFPVLPCEYGMLEEMQLPGASFPDPNSWFTPSLLMNVFQCGRDRVSSERVKNDEL